MILFLASIVVGLAAGYLRKGRISHLPSLHLRGLWLVLLPLLIQLAIFPLVSERPLFPYATVPLHILSYVILGVWLVVNLRMPPLLVIGVGGGLNVLVVGVNGGYMPVSATALIRAGQTAVAELLQRGDAYGNVILMTDDTRLNLLGDIVPLPHLVPMAAVFSIGDLLIAIGVAWLIAKGMKGYA